MNTKRKSIRSRWLPQLLIAAAVVTGMATYAVYKLDPVPVHTQYLPAREHAWEKIKPRLNAADHAGVESANIHRARVAAFFVERKRNTRAFGEAVLSLGGKWAFVKSKLPFTDGVEGHRQYLHERFEQIVVSGSDLQDLIQSEVAGYITELQGIENDLLVKIRADLSDSDLARFETVAMLQTDEAFRKEYARSLERVSAVVGRDVMFQVGRETVTLVAADIATNITISLAAVLAERLGISAGILGTGAAAGTATLGFGIAAGFILDALLDWVMKACGHDPAGDIAEKIDQTLDMFQELLLDGDAKAVRTYQTLRRLQNDDRFSFVRDKCRRAAERIDTGGYLGIQHELKRLRETRSRLRGEALSKLILEGGTP